MGYAKISQTAHYVPDQVVPNSALSSIMDTSDEWITSRTGIKTRHITRDEQTSDLATEVARKLLTQANLSADVLDFIIVATITPDSLMPSTAARVQANIGATSAFAFDITAACSGFVFALATAEKLITSGAYRKGLVIGAEVLSKVIDWSDRTTAVLFGDGAGGVLLETAETQHFLHESLNTDGSRGESLVASYTGLSSPYSDETMSHHYLRQQGRAVFEFAIRDVVAELKLVLASQDLEADEVDYFLLHQANNRMLDKMAMKLGISREKMPANMMKYGNTSAASVPIILSEMVNSGAIALNGTQKVILAGFGGGLTWGVLTVLI